MSKERDWMDYAQLGLSAVQTAQLGQVANEMGRVAEETAKMRLVAESQAQAVRDAHTAQERKSQRLKQLRQMAWMAEQFLNRLESGNDDKTPLQGKFVYALEIEAALKKSELIPPTGLDNWEDMDRIGKLASRLEGFQSTLAKSLTAVQRQEAELCQKYRAEQAELEQMIEKRTLLEKRRESLAKEIGE